MNPIARKLMLAALAAMCGMGAIVSAPEPAGAAVVQDATSYGLIYVDLAVPVTDWIGTPPVAIADLGTKQLRLNFFRPVGSSQFLPGTMTIYNPDGTVFYSAANLPSPTITVDSNGITTLTLFRQAGFEDLSVRITINPVYPGGGINYVDIRKFQGAYSVFRDWSISALKPIGEPIAIIDP